MAAALCTVLVIFMGSVRWRNCRQGARSKCLLYKESSIAMAYEGLRYRNCLVRPPSSLCTMSPRSRVALLNSGSKQEAVLHEAGSRRLISRDRLGIRMTLSGVGFSESGCGDLKSTRPDAAVMRQSETCVVPDFDSRGFAVHRPRKNLWESFRTETK